MENKIKLLINFLPLVFGGFIAAYLSIPLTQWLFGVTITVSGSGVVLGMYAYIISTLISSTGILLVITGICLILLALIVLFEKLLK